MKKKMKEEEEIKNNIADKHSENKDNTAPVNGQDPAAASQQQGTGQEQTANGNGSNDSQAADKLKNDIRIIEEKLADMQDKYLRLSAEFDNYRKRTLREKMEMSKYAGENLLLSILPLMDDFERALKHMEAGTDCVALKDGIDIIYVKFCDFLKQNGVKEIETLNSNFNVDLHEAVAKTQVEDPAMKGRVVDVVLKGYYLQDKILRFSKVVVGE